MRWDDVHERQPRLAAIATDRLVAPGVGDPEDEQDVLVRRPSSRPAARG